MSIPKAKVFLETSVLSYLTARPSRDIVHAAHQQITRKWWSKRNRFELYVSQAVLGEAGRGNASAAALRLSVVKGVPVLAVTGEASDLAERFLRENALPAKAAIDAIHIAVSVVHGMDYLLTWNCTHIANARVRVTIDQICRAEGLRPSMICTPEELMEV
jgi:predicted nucleic acid-binding protein